MSSDVCGERNNNSQLYLMMYTSNDLPREKFYYAYESFETGNKWRTTGRAAQENERVKAGEISVKTNNNNGSVTFDLVCWTFNTRQKYLEEVKREKRKKRNNLF